MASQLDEFLRRQRDSIIEKWVDRILGFYPAGAFKFLKFENDQFQNPVGHTLREGIAVLFDALLGGADFETPNSSLDSIVRIRAVQDGTPSQAVAFVFLLKDIIRKELLDMPCDNTVYENLAEFELRVDRLALAAFDNYMRCREKIYEIRAREEKMRSAKLLERLSRLDGNADLSPGGREGDSKDVVL